MPRKKIAKRTRNSKQKISAKKKNEKNTFQEINVNVKKVKELFSRRIIKRLAKATGFLKRRRKLNEYEFFLALSFGGLKGTVVTLAAMRENMTKNITRMAISKKFTEEAYDFLMGIYSHFFKILSKKMDRINVDVIYKFKAIKIIDSSSWKIPKALSGVLKGYNGAGCKVQMMLDYGTGLIQLLAITKESFNDQSYAKTIKEQIHVNDLFIFDLGYSIPIFLKTIVERTAFFLSRFNYHAMRLYVKKGAVFYEVDILEVLKKQRFINQF